MQGTHQEQGCQFDSVGSFTSFVGAFDQDVLFVVQNL